MLSDRVCAFLFLFFLFFFKRKCVDRKSREENDFRVPDGNRRG